MVRTLAAVGISHDHIRLKIINPQTHKPIAERSLEKWFREELASDVDANATVAGQLYKQATGQLGNTSHAVTAAIFWMKTRGKWSERQRSPVSAPDEKIEITAERVVAELAKMGFGSIDDYMRAPDKRAALVDLGKHLGLFREASLEGTDEHDIRITGGLPDDK